MQEQKQKNKAKTIFKILYNSQDPFAVFVKTVCEPTGEPVGVGVYGHGQLWNQVVQVHPNVYILHKGLFQQFSVKYFHLAQY
eukprot:1159406-Pelagomonas_calceolata.AAC.5